jgi:hypothetical protein
VFGVHLAQTYGTARIDETYQEFRPETAAGHPAIRIYPTLVIRPGESIDVRIGNGIVWCG